MTHTRPSLTARVEEQVEACIGCHDCMLACPLPQSAGVSIAELNEAVSLPVIQSPNVVDFLLACTQCRQCVPACPADLSRADMVLFNKLKVEDHLPDHELLLQVGDGVHPSGITLDGLAAQLATLTLFADVDPADIRRMLLSVTLRRLGPGEALCTEGEFHDRLTVILHGTVEQSAIDQDGNPVRIVLLGVGSFFGEMAVLADQPEPFTVVALEPSMVVETPKAAVQRLMDDSPAFRQTMQDLHVQRALWTYATKSAAIGHLPEEAVRELLSHAELVMLKAGEQLFREGDRPRDVFLVQSGFLRASRTVPHGEVGLVYFREGAVFGLLPLLLGEVAQMYSVTASSRTDVVRIPGQVFVEIANRYEQARPGLMAAAAESEQAARTSAWAQSQAMTQQQATVPRPTKKRSKVTMVQELSFDVLVEQGVAQGREVLVVDQNSCTGCLNCVDACGRRHGEHRLQLRGLQVENFLFPSGCRHCDDPRCLLCSVNGIVRKPTGEIVIVEDNCIGCGSCADRCPYGTITMQLVDPPKRSIWRALGEYLWGIGREPANADSEVEGPRKAVKCDLCADYDDYACVTACPVGAAFRIDPAEVGSGDEPLAMTNRGPDR